MKKMNARQLRKTKPVNAEEKKIKKNPIFFVLDNVLDTYNIGSLFRLADALAIEKIYICGMSDYPPSSRIHKAAVGTEEWVAWEKRDNALEVVSELKGKNIKIVAVEQNENATDIRKITKEIISFPLAIVIGHETNGVSGDVLKAADLIIELPMYGVNKSFNVWGTCAVAAYKLIEYL